MKAVDPILIEKAMQEKAALEIQLEAAQSAVAAMAERIAHLQGFIEMSREYQSAALSNQIQKASLPAPTVKARIILFSSQYLADGQWRKTAQILAFLEANGIQINSKNKEMSVSAVLSREKSVFRSSRKYGWSLVPSLPK